MDTHIYQMFSQDVSSFKTALSPRGIHVCCSPHLFVAVFQEVSRSNAEHISSACSMASDLSNFDLWLIVGEWTPAPTDCATYLNGRGVGARYDGTYPGSTYVGSCTGLTGSSSSFSSSYKSFLRQYWEAQVRHHSRTPIIAQAHVDDVTCQHQVTTYEKASGWIQWTWKAESADDWTYQAGLAGGWIPQNPTELLYPDICD